jgi:UDP-glucose 4-epimerase
MCSSLPRPHGFEAAVRLPAESSTPAVGVSPIVKTVVARFLPGRPSRPDGDGPGQFAGRKTKGRETDVRFLVTGGAGFVGSHLAEELLRRGHTVHVLDDLSTGAMDNIKELKRHPRFSYTIESANNGPVIAEAVDDADVIYHLAAAVGVALIVESPVRTIETNVHCTEVVLAAASKKRKPVFLASTSEVYGKSADIPFREDGDLVMGPTHAGRWSYACSKAIDEYLGLAYWRERKLPVIIGRLFNTVGPRQTGRYGMVLPNFVQQALAGRPLRVFGDGTQRRCFCHVDDVVAALADIVMHDAAQGQVFNIGSTEEVSIRELAERVRAAAGSSSDICLVPYHEAYEQGFEDMQRRIPATDKIAGLLGWQPARSLDQTIEEVIAYYRSRDDLGWVNGRLGIRRPAWPAGAGVPRRAAPEAEVARPG